MIAYIPSSAEPIGIVISSGRRTEPTPRFWAYLWEPAPEDQAVTQSTPKAA